MQKQQWDTLEMLEESIRSLCSHPRFSEEPEIATLGGEFLFEAAKLAQWRCFTDNIIEDSDDSTSAAAGGGSCSSASLCSSLLRLISLALTVAKAAACCSDISRLGSAGASFELWKTCLTAVRLFGLPQGMQAARGLAALLLNPACRGVQRLIITIVPKGSPQEAALALDAVSCLLILLQRCCNSLPPRLAVDVLMAGPALAIFEQEAERLPQQVPVPADSAAVGAVGSGSAAVGSNRRQQAAVSATANDFDGLATSIASYFYSLSQGLACVVFGVPPLGTKQRASNFAQGKLLQWLSLVLEPGSRPEGYGLQDGEPFFSSAFQAVPGSATPELTGGSVATLSHILSSPTWDRLVGYNSTSSAATISAWLVHVTSSLCCVAAVLELHPAVRFQRSSRMGDSILDGGYADAPAVSVLAPPLNGGSADAALSVSVPAPPPLGPGPAAVTVSSSLSQWREARNSIAKTLRLLSATTPASRAAVAGVLRGALGQVREVLSSLVRSQAAALEGDSLGAATGTATETATETIAAVAIQTRSSGSFCIRDWECVQSELLLGLPEELWGVRPCCNTACVRLEGPCEMEVKTQACGGGCGARYCCVACQEQAWRSGHRRNCAPMRVMRERWDRANGPQVSVEQR